MRTSLTAAAALVAASLLAVSANAQDDDAARAAALASVAGTWSGSGENFNAATMAMEPIEDTFSLAILSEDGLDYAFWQGAVLVIAEAVGDGTWRNRTWLAAGNGAPAGLASDETIPFGALEGPDADGAWTLTRDSEVTGPDGAAYDQSIVYDFAGDALSLDITVTPAGGGQPIPVRSVAYTRAE